MKKMLLLVMAFTLFLAYVAPDADARRSGRSGFTQTPKKPADNNVQRSDQGTQSQQPGATAGSAANRGGGFFSGGGLMKGLMIGGLAGMLFGGLFGGMGFMGEFLGLLVNVLAIFLLFVAIRGIIQYFRNRKRVDDNRRPY
ncbi:hypothetical protein [Paenibacillus abyssi]|uniref:Preprotein translocase subunit Tim44 n=1 Tax=Paenibacillus abyssi TaxID=1340531 RepID=A0A917CJL6_9BACL|nr:hypothetical protein [Paenibacillus abyssi]GGF89549.1 hypothetical protein GCM10010916_03600 [Paenibacillus abyssi]